MEETKGAEGKFSQEPSPGTHLSSPENRPPSEPPTSQVIDNNKQEKTAENAVTSVRQDVPGGSSVDHKTPVSLETMPTSEPQTSLAPDNHQQEAIIEGSVMPVQQDVPDSSSLDHKIPSSSENLLTSESHSPVTADHQQETVVGDSVTSVHQDVSNGSSLDHDASHFEGSSKVSGSTAQNIVAASSGLPANSKPHLLETIQEAVESMPHQLEEGTSDRFAHEQTSNDSTAFFVKEEGKRHDVQNNNISTPSAEIKKTVALPQIVAGSVQKKTLQSANSVKHVAPVNANQGLVDTATPFESVKEAVTKFGGIVDWKAHKAQTVEREKHVQLEVEKAQVEIPEYKKQSEAVEEAKAQVLKELDRTKRLIEELKLKLERAQTEEVEAKQDSQLAELRVKEMEEGITDGHAAKAQLDVAKARHDAAVAELKSVKQELQLLQGQYVSMINERDMAIRKAEDAVSASKEIEKTVEELTLELIATKESLELAEAAHLEAEEHRIGAELARDQDYLTWEKELKQAEEEHRRLNEQLSSVKDLKSKLDTASALLLNLKAELAAYMEAKLNQESKGTAEEKLAEDMDETKRTQRSFQELLASTTKELEEVKAKIEKAKDEVNLLRVAATSLKSELDAEKAALATLQQREGMASIAVSSLEAELERAKQNLEMVRAKEKETREKMVELPKLLQKAAQEADRSKSDAQLAGEELRKVKEEAEQAKAGVSTAEIRLNAALKEIEAAKASEKLALGAIKALQESEQAASIGGEDSPSGIVLPLDEYFTLSKSTHEAEEQAHERVIAAIAQIQAAKESESKSLARLEEAYREMDKRKEAWRVAMERAEKANEGKLGVEQELRKWRAEHEQRRKAGDAAKVAVDPSRSPPKSFAYTDEPKSSNKEETAALIHPVPNPKLYISEDSPAVGPDTKVRKKKKKRSFFPRIVMLLARKKSQKIE